jgi:peptidoglycan/LPS O-acetylase OafA/YrhL
MTRTNFLARRAILRPQSAEPLNLRHKILTQAPAVDEAGAVAERAKQPARLLGVQLARGAAALLVVCYHAGKGLEPPQYLGFAPLGGVFRFGHAGVDFFFVLSGFIIFYVHHGDIGRPAALPRYAWRRLARVYPIYWCVTLLVLLLAALRPDAAFDPVYLLKSALLLPQTADPPVGVAWTLSREMLFYAVFALAIASRRLGLIATALWCCAVVAGRFVTFEHPLLAAFASLWDAQFLLGAIAAHVTLTRAIRRPRVWAALGAAAFLATGLAENAGALAVAGADRLLFGAAAAVAVAGIAGAERQGLLRVGRAAAWLGDASYSLYLIHPTAIGLAARVLAAAGLLAAMPGPVAFAVVAVAGVAAGVALYLTVERPLLRRLGHLWPARKASVVIHR